MGGMPLTFGMSSWSVMSSGTLVVGGVLVVVMIMATTAICLICYYWGLLLKKALYETGAAPTVAPPPPPPPPPIAPPSQIIATSDYKLYMTLEPPCTCLPSTIVLMPGEDTPTFLALPCTSTSVDIGAQDNNETQKAIASMGNVEVKVDSPHLSSLAPHSPEPSI